MLNKLHNRTKIVATVGPASNSKEKLLELMIAGVDVFRLNFSHGTHEEHQKVINHIRELNAKFGGNVAILQDLQGPKIRLREIEGGSITVAKDETVVIAYEKEVGTREKLTSTYDLAQDVKPGEPILIDDGNIELRVTAVEGNRVITKVVYGGVIKPKKGINLPNTNVSEPSLTKKDREDLAFGLQNEVDWIALSFVRQATDILELKQIIKDSGKNSKVIAKIETPTALKNIDSIIEATDGVMVARGDLGVEIPLEEVPIEQKRWVRRCNVAAKPVIVATQMMESMINNPRPTRAEAGDVANAVIDGADAVMLSAETASGHYPVETIQNMVRIIHSAERHPDIYNRNYHLDKNSPNFYAQSLVSHACKLAKEVGAKAIIGITQSGSSAFRLSSYRSESQTFIFTNNMSLVTTLNLLWGVKCFYYDNFVSTNQTFEEVEKILVNAGHLQKGDIYINMASIPMKEKKKTNMLKLSWVE
ncbi:pyruvate kinase [Thermoflexibacter ruber]|uniref:Pyruvate kinase n=1 Tax=Thermoflexibacter ruber TaxID=1003 RepID=A0A1I2HZR0_9BACT|nr:pyruvate kinase [Thermoflexibacter ruber]SFF34928.1 pyruvate kinase [Thermoflexibacter ruber]